MLQWTKMPGCSARGVCLETTKHFCCLRALAKKHGTPMKSGFERVVAVVCIMVLSMLRYDAVSLPGLWGRGGRRGLRTEARAQVERWSGLTPIKS